MGFHKISATRNMRIKHAHLERKESGDVYGIYVDFRYCFIGEENNTLTLKGEVITKHPRFKGIGQFEGWCMRYYAEHDV